MKVLHRDPNTGGFSHMYMRAVGNIRQTPHLTAASYQAMANYTHNRR